VLTYASVPPIPRSRLRAGVGPRLRVTPQIETLPRLACPRAEDYNTVVIQIPRFQGIVARLAVKRHRRILIASGITLAVSALLLGLIGFTKWRGRQALESDTSSVITQVSEQLVRSLHSRRGTLTFIRDTLNRRADLAMPHLQAMGASAVEHTRHLTGVGLIRAGQAMVWWSAPSDLSSSVSAKLHRAIAQRTQLRGVWRVSSTFVTEPAPQRPILVMLEPLRHTAYQQSAIVGVFDLRPLLGDFFASGLPQRYPVQLLDEDTLLYQSAGWQESSRGTAGVVATHPVTVDAARWTLELAPARTGVVQTLSWFTILLITLSIVAGLGITVIVWILAARTWILQRAVARRTAALRRTSERLRQMAITDELTGLYNRRFFLDRWAWECERAKRYQRPIACLMIDVNGFKQVNDRLGHHTGDLLLQQVAEELKTALRQSDILARFGGDEFVIALPETPLEKAESVAEKLRQIAILIPHDRGKTAVPPVSLSVGVSRAEERHETPQAVLDAADQSLYAWKRRLKAQSVT